MGGKEPEPRVSTADTRTHYQGIRPFYNLSRPDTPIPPSLVQVYSEYTALDRRDPPMVVEILGHGNFMLSELAFHMEQGDEVGRDWAETLLEGEYAHLSKAKQAEVQVNPELLFQQTVRVYEAAIEKRKNPLKNSLQQPE